MGSLLLLRLWLTHSVASICIPYTVFIAVAADSECRHRGERFRAKVLQNMDKLADNGARYFVEGGRVVPLPPPNASTSYQVNMIQGALKKKVSSTQYPNSLC